ncbi:uncharacterized protein LOC62_01G001059 [Vanrija pseudolonga]|uniref:Uncharacterized protein n=1 Tax=Vanrija pseudolonga TaxID=143232 RepID=A0AAF0Y024_9TREE|nr:hypothetical protein LOC62_01G001059 [Vanrija pseudolonga]
MWLLRLVLIAATTHAAALPQILPSSTSFPYIAVPPGSSTSSGSSSTTTTATRTSSATAARSATSSSSASSGCGSGCRAWNGFWAFFVKSWYWFIPCIGVFFVLVWILFTCLPCTNYAKYRRHLARERRIMSSKSYGGPVDWFVDWVKSLHAVRKKKHKNLNTEHDVRDVPLLGGVRAPEGQGYWMPDASWQAPVAYPSATAPAAYPSTTVGSLSGVHTAYPAISPSPLPPSPSPSPSPAPPVPPPPRLARRPSEAVSEQLPGYEEVPANLRA